MVDTQPSDNPQSYNTDDIRSLDTESKAVLQTIAAQNKLIDVEDVAPPPDGQSTTTTVRESTGLGRDKTNYRLRILSGVASSGCDPALIETHLPDVPETGKMPPKQLTLTHAGEKAVTSDSVETDPQTDLPVWITSADTDERVETIARRVDELELMTSKMKHAVDEIAMHLGFETTDELITLIERDGQELPRKDVLQNPSATGELTMRDDSILEVLAVMYQGFEAVETSVKDLDATPAEYYEPPEDVAEVNGGDENGP